jgi:hypothetical protein
MTQIILGGKERVITGWGEYEVSKRKIRDEPYETYYPNKYFIYPNDVVDSVLKQNSATATVNKFAETLQNVENKYISDDFEYEYTIPSLTSEKLFEFATSSLIKTKEELINMNDSLKSFAELLNIDVKLDDITINDHEFIEPVHVSNKHELQQMETKLLPYITDIERCQGIFALNCDKIHYILNKSGGNDTPAEFTDVPIDEVPAEFTDDMPIDIITDLNNDISDDAPTEFTDITTDIVDTNTDIMVDLNIFYIDYN